MRPEDDALIAELLLKRGWLDSAKVRRAAEICEAARALDLGQDLLQVLAQKGFVDERELHELEGELGLDYLTRPEYVQAISGYRIWSKLEPWGLGAVFKGLQLSMERPVALKVLAPAAAGDTDLLSRFLAEGRCAGQVDHPNLVGALDLGQSGQYYYYATELLEGQSLREALRGGPLPVGRAMHVARQMAQALAHLHELGLTHRDVQPANIVLLPDDTARLRNLGATRLPGDPSVAATGIPIGAPGYTAPELLAASGGPADIRADIYSLGATLHHAVTGHRPARADAGPMLPPAMVRSEVPAAVSDLVCRMAAVDPAERPQSPQDLLRDLDAAQAGEPLGMPPLPAEAAAVAPPAIAPPTAPALAPDEAAAPGIPAAAEAGPPLAQGSGRRKLAQVVWVAVFATLSVAFVAASAWAIWSKFGPRGAARPSAAEPPPEKQAKEGPEPAKDVRPPPPPPPPPEPELAEPARRLVADALAFDKTNPDEHAEAGLRLRRALLVAGDSSWAMRLRVRLATRQQMLSGEANSAYGELSDRLAALRSQGRFGAALQAAQAAPAALRYGPWADLVAARLAELGEEAERQCLSLATKGAAALLASRLDEGVSHYKAIADIGIPWMTRAAEPLAAAAAAFVEERQAELKEAAARRALLERRRLLGGLARSFAAIHEEIKKRDYAKALELCKAVPETLRDGGRAPALANLQRRLELLVEVWEAILKGPTAAIGRAFSLHGQEWTVEGFAGSGLNAQIVLRTRTGAAERTLRQPVWRLPGPQLARLAEWATERGPAGIAAVKVGFLCLTEGEAAQARQKFQEAGKAGEDVSPWLDELEAEAVVTAALTAHRQKEWAEARKLLETALDRLGTTSPVILSHRALANALADCLVKLGEPAARPAAPELPDLLYSRVLLPETRLGILPPASPLDEHLGTPLRRSGPQRLGLDVWRDYTLSLRWTPEGQSRMLLGARLAEPQPGVFHYYYVAVGEGQATLGLRGAKGDKVLASKPYPASAGPAAAHQLTFSLAGNSLTAELGDGTTLTATDSTLAAGRVLLAAPDGAILVHELLGSSRPPKRPTPKGK
ncbi:MAG TPA: serine/threonine-protein kinase [Planctomycetota bacterium]|nr:serine/threonine-protein kinase [Planctomycetota bacterium]